MICAICCSNHLTLIPCLKGGFRTRQQMRKCHISMTSVHSGSVSTFPVPVHSGFGSQRLRFTVVPVQCGARQFRFTAVPVRSGSGSQRFRFDGNLTGSGTERFWFTAIRGVVSDGVRGKKRHVRGCRVCVRGVSGVCQGGSGD